MDIQPSRFYRPSDGHHRIGETGFNLPSLDVHNVVALTFWLGLLSGAVGTGGDGGRSSRARVRVFVVSHDEG